MRGVLTVMLAGTWVASAASLEAAPVTIVDTSFNSLATGALSHNVSVDGFSIALTSSNAPAGTAGMDIVQVGDNDRALVMWENKSTVGATTNAVPYLRTTFSGVTSGTTGNNYIAGSFTFTRLALSASATGENDLQFAINASSANISDTVTLMALRLNTSKHSQTGADQTTLQYSDATGTQSQTVSRATFPIDIGVTYRVNMVLDLSLEADAYAFSLTNTATNARYDSAWISTRIQNASPTDIVFKGGIDGASYSSEPFIRLDDISFTAVPEPSVAGGLLVGLLGLKRPVRRRKNAANG